VDNEEATVVEPGSEDPGNERLLNPDGGIVGMATETLDQRASHIRGLTVTSIATLAGIAAALVTTLIATGPQDTIGIAVLGAFVIGQFPLLQLLGIETESLSAKDYLYITFMTFSLWYVTWAILLTTETTL
jgi:hypothetical protein